MKAYRIVNFLVFLMSPTGEYTEDPIGAVSTKKLISAYSTPIPDGESPTKMEMAPQPKVPRWWETIPDWEKLITR